MVGEGSVTPPSPSMRGCQKSPNLPLMVSKAGAADLMKSFDLHRPCSTASRTGRGWQPEASAGASDCTELMS